MGSLSGNGVPVADKDNRTFRKRDVLITAAASENDTVTNLVTTAPERAVGSGSIVRDDGSVEYTEEVVWGVTKFGRTCRERVASNEDCVREVLVTLPEGSGTVAVIPDSLVDPINHSSMRHLGETISHGRSDNDTVVERIPGSGVFDDGFPL